MKMLAEEKELRDSIYGMYEARAINRLITTLVKAIREDCVGLIEDRCKNLNGRRVCYACAGAISAIRRDGRKG